MRNLRALLVVCAATAAQFALADDQATLAAIRAACAEDAQKLCAGVPLGGGRIVACLKEHEDSLSDRCKQAAGLAANPSSSSAPSASSVSPASGTHVPGAAAGSPATSSRSVAGPSVSAAASKAKSAPALKADPATAGEKFVEHIITDTEHGGMRAATIYLPEKWHFESKIEWHYNWIEYPLTFSSHAENADNAEAYFQYPLLRFDYTEVPPQYRQYVKGPKTGPGEHLSTGALFSPPQAPVQALAAFIQQVRPNAANFKWVGQQDLPDLANALHLDPWPNQRGVAIKISYDLNGQPVEEAFFGLYYLSSGANTGVNAGVIKQTN